MNIEVNENVKCRQCGKGGAIKTDEMDEFGVCLDCALKNMKGSKSIRRTPPKKMNLKSLLPLTLDRIHQGISPAKSGSPLPSQK